MKKFVFIISFSALLASCQKTESVQTVDWYRQHKTERETLLKKCNDNPGQLMNTPNCMNASRAESEITWSSRDID